MYGLFNFIYTMKRRYSSADLGATYGSAYQRNKRRQAAIKRRRLKSTPNGAITQTAVQRGYTGRAIEAKWRDAGLATYACNTTGSITHIDVVQQGNSINQREGRGFQITSIAVKGYCIADSAATVQMVAAYLVWDNQPNKALAGINDILNGTSPFSWSNRENTQRFTILKKWVRTLEGTDAGTVGKSTFKIDWWKKTTKLNLQAACTTNDTLGTIGGRVTGALLFITVGDQVAGTGDANIKCNFRIGFKD